MVSFLFAVFLVLGIFYWVKKREKKQEEKELAEIEKKADMIENKYNNWEILNKIFLEILEQ